MKRAFTLIELLVVIAIIAILAAILFPVFAQAKLAAKKTQSLSNVKQLVLATLMYQNDADDTYPIGCGASWYYPTGGGWSWDTQPYIKSVGLLNDPSDPKSTFFWASWFGTTTVHLSYASNGFIGWNGSANHMFGLMGMDQSWIDGNIASASKVTQPSATIAFSSRYGGNNIFGGGDIMIGCCYDSTAPQAIPDGSRAVNTPYTITQNGSTYTVNADQRFGAVAAPYSNLGLFGFADGHAKALNPTSTNPNPTNNAATDPANMWNAER